VAQPRLAMRKIKDILRLHLVGGVSSCRQLARAAGCGKSAVADCLRRAAEAGLDRWETIVALDESDLEQRLYPLSTAPIIRKQRPLPDWSKIREELARRDHHVMLALLWTEYKAEHPDGYQYSQFVDRYRRFEKKLSVVLRQHHRAGEKVFVDFRDGITMIDPDSGELVKTRAQLQEVQPYHRSVASTGLSSRPPGMHALATDPMGTIGRCKHGGGRRVCDPKQAPPRARLSLCAGLASAAREAYGEPTGARL